MSTRSHLLSKHIQHASFAARMLDASVCTRARARARACVRVVCAREHACSFHSCRTSTRVWCSRARRRRKWRGRPARPKRMRLERSSSTQSHELRSPALVFALLLTGSRCACACACACACVCICVCVCVLTDRKEIQAWRRFDTRTHTNIHPGAGPDVPHPKGQRLERDSKPRHPHRALGGSCLPGILALGATRDKTRTATQ